MSHHHLTKAERKVIHVGLQQGLPISLIARRLGRHRSTVYREIKRNAYRHGYCQSKAHEQAMSRLRKRARRSRIDPGVWLTAQDFLRQRYTPEQIACVLPISHQSLYRRIERDRREGGALWRHLVRPRKSARRTEGTVAPQSGRRCESAPAVSSGAKRSGM